MLQILQFIDILTFTKRFQSFFRIRDNCFEVCDFDDAWSLILNEVGVVVTSCQFRQQWKIKHSLQTLYMS